MSTTSQPVQGSKLPKLARNGELARVALAFLATAGLFYVNIMPALVDGLIDGLGFSNQDAGFVGSANVYGAAVGAFGVVFLIKRLNWRLTAYGLLGALIVMDLLSMLVKTPHLMMATRFIHGVVGGALVGIGFAVIARTTNADRTFGYLLSVQFGLGGVGLMYLPPLVPEYGTTALFIALIAFSLVTLLMVPFLDDYHPEESVKTPLEGKSKLSKPLLLALLATFFFQAANMAVYAYIIGLGRSVGLDIDSISTTLGQAAWLGILGSGLVIILSTKFGRLFPLAAGILLTAAGTWAFHFSELPWVYWVANVAVGITWAFVISYLLGLCAEFDTTGQMAALGGFASKMGLASGPMAAALVVGDGDYATMLNAGVLSLLLCLALVAVPARLLDKRS
ncbi:MFS transporter [Umboniibacter marinipuniceus]|uniref:Putative MFS family arabinose efflux permease n=1 Tax=Umboniibacter marinipuniceus TaxID=569599 RepID=A0A3M0A126_9GAMM|nr:MFS transporter [Umboniibacter marinipuniceus]RMA78470.1 putative MFS family arabinose efflux permease [Umboniibacter marinipuniceus]